MHKYLVVKSRKWHQPNVETFVTTGEVGSRIDLDDFIAALVAEIGRPTFILTTKQLTAKLEAAVEVTLNEMTSHTAKVV